MSVFGSVKNYQGAAGGMYANADTPTSGSSISPGSITNVQIANQTILATNIANNTITAAQIAPGTITNTEIANNTITGAKIVNATITADKLAAGTDGSVLYYDNATASWKTDNASRCCIGTDTYNNAAFNTVTLGNGATTVGGAGAVAVGNLAAANSINSISIGSNSTATATNAVTVGSGADASALNAIALGINSGATLANSFAIGANATVVSASNAAGFAVDALSAPAGKFGITLNSAARELETHTQFYTVSAAAGTVSLTTTAPRIVRYLNATQINLPDATTLTNGFSIKILNSNLVSLPVHISTGAGLIFTVPSGVDREFICVDATANTVNSWWVVTQTIEYAADATAGIVSLTSSAARAIRFLNATEVRLPLCSTATLTNGFNVKVINSTLATLPVHISGGGGLVVSIPSGEDRTLICVDNTVNAVLSWYEVGLRYLAGSHQIYGHFSLANYVTGVGAVINWQNQIAPIGSSLAWAAGPTGVINVLTSGVYLITLKLNGSTSGQVNLDINGAIWYSSLLNAAVQDESQTTLVRYISAGETISAIAVNSFNLTGTVAGLNYSFIEVVRLS